MKDYWSDPINALKRSADISRGSLRSMIQSNRISELILYLCVIDEGIKFGVTTDIDSRISTLSNIYSIHDTVIFIGPASQVIDLEYDIKLKYISKSLALKDYNYCDFNGWSEVIVGVDKDELINYILSTNLIKLI